MRRRLASTVLLLAVAAIPPGVRAGEPSPVEQAFAAWRVARARPLGEKIAAAKRLAATRDPAALKELLAECGKSAKHQDKFNELLAPSLAWAFAAPEFAPTLSDALLTRLNRPEDAWIAHQVAAAWKSAGTPGAAVDLFLHAAALPFHQAAVLRAFAAAPDAVALSIAQETLSTLPSVEPQRTVLLEAAARVVEANTPPGVGESARAAVEPLLARLDDKQTTRRTATILGRTIARILDSDTVYADSASWRRFIEDRSAAEKLAKEGYAPSHTYFAGVLLTGRDIVYVIDSSGSMSAPFTWRPTAPQTLSAPASPAAPFTGKGADDAERRRREQQARSEQDVFRSLNSLPWDKIHTRLEAVREALKASLRALQEDQRFAVIMFSGEARYLNATTKLTQATHANVEAACADVDAFGPGGATNIHRALELAFGASRAKVEDPATGVGAEQILAGADTIVLLTDGDPTTDSYDLREELYASNENILAAARRWNLFLDCEINCVGLADAPESLLASLARQGAGKCRFLGK
jgi:Mg-chelatase subunit ChlD